VTSGVWITPAGVNLAGAGLIPDIVVENTDGLSGGVEDPVLRAGLRMVRQID
jgi:C-terminal processing protease CtpA/Prc